MHKTEEKQRSLPAVLCCRACLTTDCRLYDIREYKADDAFERITESTVSQDLPHHLCSWCFTVLRKCASFKDMCVLSQQRLTDIHKWRFDPDGIQRCHPHQSFHLAKTEVKILECVPSTNNIIYEPEDDTVKAEPHIEYEDDYDIQASFDFKDERDITRQGNTVKENIVFKIGSTDKLLDDIIEPVLKEEHIEGEMDNSDNGMEKILLGNNKVVISKKNNPINHKVEKKRDKTKLTKGREDGVKQMKSVKRGRPRTRVKIKDLRHPIDGYILFDFAAFESAYAVKVVVLSKEEQLEEILSRKKSRNYLESPFKCEDCGKGYLLEAAYTNHQVKHHNPSMEHACEICGMRFKVNCLRQKHEDMHRLKFPCNECDFVSRCREQAKAHHAYHEGKMFKCQHCGKTFNKRTSYFSHVRLVHPEHNVACGECGETFVGDKGLRGHMKKTHAQSLKSQQFKCGTCSATFLSVLALNRHTEEGEHSGLPCEQCGDNCASEAELREHVKEIHPTESHHCEECNMAFTSSGAYDTHVRRKHHGERYSGPSRPRLPPLKPQRRYKDKPCVCEQCGYIARNSSFLVYHMRSHLAVKPFACAHCPKTFEIKNKLTYHMRTHTGERPYKCSECSLAFALPGNLRRHHKTIHLKQHDSFSCEICARTFTTKGMLKMHVKTIHEGIPWPKRVRKAKDTP